MKWLPIETAPLDGTKVDLWDRRGFRWPDRAWTHHSYRDGQPGQKSWGEGSRVTLAPDPTHWMPRPDGPTD